MAAPLATAQGRANLRDLYRRTLLEDVTPFWLQHGLDPLHGGFLTCLDRDGSTTDTDKSIWFQGRAAWLYATLHNTLEPRPEWLAAARSGLDFLRRHGARPSDGKLWFTVTREGRPLRMRRYVYSEAFAAIAAAAIARTSGDDQAASEAQRWFDTYLHHSFTPGVMPPKSEHTRPSQGIAPHMISIVTAQELRAPDPEFGEWHGYLHRDGSPSSRAKGTLWKGPFHLPRMLWTCDRLLATP